MPKIDKDYFNIDKDPMKANAVEDILTDDEEILVRLTPNKRTFIFESIVKGLPFVLLWAGIDVAVILTMIHNHAFDTSFVPIIFIVVFFAFHLFPLWAYIGNVVKRVAGFKNVEYVFTDKRIILRSGLIGINLDSLYYSSITNVEVKVGLYDRMFKVGDIYLSVGEKKHIIDDIPNPYVYGAKIQALVHDIKTDISFPNDLRPKENHGYRTKYSRDDDDK